MIDARRVRSSPARLDPRPPVPLPSLARPHPLGDGGGGQGGAQPRKRPSPPPARSSRPVRLGVERHHGPSPARLARSQGVNFAVTLGGGVFPRERRAARSHRIPRTASP